MEMVETRWIDRLEEEDLTFIKRFILLSGSLKELAEMEADLRRKGLWRGA